MDDELIRYEKIITITPQHDQNIIQHSMNLLLQVMYDHSRQKNEWVEFFRMNLIDSEKTFGAKDLKLEWASIPTERNPCHDPILS